jgi:hypothetical protein
METVFAVVFANYSPPELNSLWATRKLADGWAGLLNREDGPGMWKVEEYVVRDRLPEDTMSALPCDCCAYTAPDFASLTAHFEREHPLEWRARCVRGKE